MDEVKAQECVAVLGDLVHSRDAVDRAGLHTDLTAALAVANAAAGDALLDPFRVTVGDEFQGVVTGWGAGLAASHRIRLALDADVRFGLGRGSVTVIDPATNLQDGTAWWAARDAIETVERRARGAHRVLRTGLAAGVDAPPPSPELISAVELADALLDGLDAASRTIVTTLAAGGSQADAADALGISRSAVSQRVGRGLAVLADALIRLEEVR